jgi:hypothetical protein
MNKRKERIGGRKEKEKGKKEKDGKKCIACKFTSNTAILLSFTNTQTQEQFTEKFPL